MHATQSDLVCVDRNSHGEWEVESAARPEPITCASLDEARRIARQLAVRRAPCEVIVRDAYHRVIGRELFGKSARR
jgi:hypothetical protein